MSKLKMDPWVPVLRRSLVFIHMEHMGTNGNQKFKMISHTLKHVSQQLYGCEIVNMERIRQDIKKTRLRVHNLVLYYREMVCREKKK